MNKKLYIKWIILFALSVIIICLTFLFSIHWHATLYSYFIKAKDKFVCYSHTNMTESYQTDCLLPEATEPFIFKNQLKCQVFTNHQFGSIEQSPSYRDQIMVIKNDSVKFILTFQNDKLIRSSSSGALGGYEDYTIVKDTNNIVQAIRPVQQENFDKEYAYEFITFSKKTGHGMEVWHNVEKNNESWPHDSIASHFFKCN